MSVLVMLQLSDCLSRPWPQTVKQRPRMEYARKIRVAVKMLSHSARLHADGDLRHRFGGGPRTPRKATAMSVRVLTRYTQV